MREYEQLKNRTIVRVSKKNLHRIRDEAAKIQDRLTLDDSKPMTLTEPKATVNNDNAAPAADVRPQVETHIPTAIEIAPLFTPPSLPTGGWSDFADNLTAEETEGLRRILNQENIQAYVSELSVMLEVFVDQINEKAIESMGDSILESDDQVYVFEDYIDDVRRIVGD